MPALPPGVTAPLADPVQARYQPLAVKHARMIWREWWGSQPAFAVDLGSDLEAISWWIVCVFRRALYIQVVRERPLVKGSTGQPVSNPLERVISGLTEDINRAEERFGMDTLSRFRLAFEPLRSRPEEGSWDRTHFEIERYRRLLEAD